jgi:hypothetical protein
MPGGRITSWPGFALRSGHTRGSTGIGQGSWRSAAARPPRSAGGLAMQVPGLDVGFEISGEATSLANVRNAAAQVPLPLQRVGWPRLPVPALLADGAHRAPSRPRASSGHHAHRAAIRRSRPGTAGEGHESMPKCLPPGTRRGTPRSHKHRRLLSGRADQPVSPGVHSGDCSFHSLQKLWDLGGVPLASFIQTRVMSSKKLVDAAVAGFIKGESNTLPSVADASLQWQESATTAGGLRRVGG